MSAPTKLIQRPMHRNHAFTDVRFATTGMMAATTAMPTTPEVRTG